MKFYRAINDFIYFILGNDVYFFNKTESLCKSMLSKKDFKSNIIHCTEVKISRSLQEQVDNLSLRLL